MNRRARPKISFAAATLLATASFAGTAAAQGYRIETLLGDFNPSEEVAPASAWTIRPTSITCDSADNVYFVESGTHRVRKVNHAGRVSTVAANGLSGFSGDGGPTRGTTGFARSMPEEPSQPLPERARRVPAAT